MRACAERWPRADSVIDERLFLAMLHRIGLNCRHLGAVRAEMLATVDGSLDHLAAFCVREACARTFKALVKRQWRQLSVSA